MDVQGPGFEHGFDHVLGSFLKNVAKTSRSDGVLSAGRGGWEQIDEFGLAWGEGGILSMRVTYFGNETWTGKNVNTHSHVVLEGARWRDG